MDGLNAELFISTAEPRQLAEADPAPLICFSHLRWDFVTQRPQHLMRRFAAERVVFYWEEAIPCDHPIPYLEYHPFPADKMIALRPRVPHWWGAAAREKALAELLAMLIATSVRTTPVLWFYTPMMFGIARQVKAQTIVYDAWTNCRPFASPTPCCSNAKPN